MNKNKLIIAAAGSGKTTFLVNQALKCATENILITTYTIANEAEIRRKIIEQKKCIPPNITIQTWFSFLLQHGVRPYQGVLNESLFKINIKGMVFSEGQSGVKCEYIDRRSGKKKKIYYSETKDFRKFYFSRDWKIYSDKISKFIFKTNKATDGELLRRLSRIYHYIFIDEVQDLAGYDLELLKLVFQSSSKTLLVGDPRQCIYRTHHERKHVPYEHGRIKEFIEDHCQDTCVIDEHTFAISHRNPDSICEYSSRLYPDLPKVCTSEFKKHQEKKDNHEGVFLLREKDVGYYLEKYKPIQLRQSVKRETYIDYPVLNFGEAKGLTFDRVLIYPAAVMKKWVFNNNTELKPKTRAQFYVAMTRAKHSVAIVMDFKDSQEISGVIKYSRED